MTEFELKFQVPEDRLAALEAALRRGPVERKRLRARYFDTPLQALARRRLVLRLRQEGEHWVQTAKGPGRDDFERLEDEAPVADPKAPPDITLHAAHPVGKLLRKALGKAQDELLPEFETDVTRLTRMVEASGTLVEIALDRGSVHAGTRSLPIQEIEFELKQGSAAAAIELARSWCEEHGLWLDPLAKSTLGRRLAQGEDKPAPVTAEDPPAHCDSTSDLLVALLGAGLRQVLGNVRELLAGGGSDEHVHQLRVGLRRLRTALRELRDFAGLASLDPAVAPALREVFHVLGHHRDRATLIPALEQELAAAGAPDLGNWRPPLPDIISALRAAPFQAALLQLLALVQELRDAPDATGLKAARKAAAARMRKLLRKVEKDGRRFTKLPDDKRHRVRKRAKRLRYLAELVQPLYDADQVQRFVDSLKELQDVLGEYQDAAGARVLFTERAQEDAKAWFAAGWLMQREQALAESCEEACRAATDKVKAFW